MSDRGDGDWPVLVKLQLIPNALGNIAVLEASKQLGFQFRRAFFLTDLPNGGRRMPHAHKALRQCAVCLRGAVTIDVEQNGERRSVRLDDYGTGMILEAGRWHEFYDFSGDALVAVLAADEYDESDYLRDYADFRAWETRRAPDRVPYVTLERQLAALENPVEAAITSVIRSGVYIGGAPVARFEAAFAAYCQSAHAVGVGNGLLALSLALRAAGIGPGDEVILPTNSAIATALAVSDVGATPVPVDVEQDTGLIDVAAASARVTARTRALIPVHLYGHPADMDPLRALATEKGLFLLEDSCQAHGARYRGSRTGSIGDAAAFSFYPTKNLGTIGDGGALVTSSAAMAATVLKLANYGTRARYDHELIGTNSRLGPLEAAILGEKLGRLDAWTDRRRAHVARYASGLQDIAGLQLPVARSWADPVWHIFPILVRDERRDALEAHLQAAGIGTNIHYPIPIHLQHCYRDMGWRAGEHPVAEQRARELLSLPLDPMHTPDEIDFVIQAVRGFFKGR